MAGRCLFVDMNSFFASVEQQERPELRERPVIVAPLLTDSTCALAASYEAKALGIKTGTSVKTARRICPEIAVVEARPKVYLDYHAAIVDVLNERLTGVRPLSIDEMACRVSRLHGSREAEIRLGQEVKTRLSRRLGPCMRCSVGIAPNVFLAKVAAETQKPDGLTIFDRENLPDALYGRDLLDLPGIGSRMFVRLARHGITTVRELYAADAVRLRRAWGSLVGVRWWEMLRGSQVADYGAYLPEQRKSVGHSHVLPPAFRTERGAKDILMRLFSRCLKRLRSYGQAAGAVEVQAQYRHSRTFATTRWRRGSRKHRHANDDITWIRTVRPLVESLPAPEPDHCPLWVGITFHDLIRCEDMNLALFDDPILRTHLSNTVDALNDEKGYVVDLASVYWMRDQAPERIAFGKPDVQTALCFEEERR